MTRPLACDTLPPSAGWREIVKHHYPRLTDLEADKLWFSTAWPCISTREAEWRLLRLPPPDPRGETP